MAMDGWWGEPIEVDGEGAERVCTAQLKRLLDGQGQVDLTASTSKGILALASAVARLAPAAGASAGQPPAATVLRCQTGLTPPPGGGSPRPRLAPTLRVALRGAGPPPLILGLCNPLLDMLLHVEFEELARWEVSSNSACLAQQKHDVLFEELLHRPGVQLVPGGSGLNTCRYAQWLLSRRGSAAYLGTVGEDDVGALLIDAARREGVLMPRVQIGGGQHSSGTCAVLVTGMDRSLIARLGASGIFPRGWLGRGDVAHLLESVRLLYVTGFFLRSAPEATMAVAENARATGRPFCLNISAAFLAKCFSQLFEEVMPYVDYLFGNEEESRALVESMGIDCPSAGLPDVAAALQRLPHGADSAHSPRVVVLTQGPEPTVIATKDGTTEYPTLRLRAKAVVDTNGAGDAFVAGFLSGVVSGADMQQCCEKARFAAAVVVGRDGCSVPAERPHEVSLDLVREKAPEAVERLTQILVRLHPSLSSGEQRTLCDNMELRHIAPGEVVVSQGDKGEEFYVVDSGHLSVTIGGEKVAELGPGDKFGEQALLNDAPRAATVTATEEGASLWALEKFAYVRVLREHTLRQRERYVGLLGRAGVFDALSAYERARLSDFLEHCEFAPGEVICREGDPGDAFYLIESGEVDISRQGQGHLARLGPGQSFGEAALLYSQDRNATATAHNRALLAKLSKDEFVRWGAPVCALRQQAQARLCRRGSKGSQESEFGERMDTGLDEYSGGGFASTLRGPRIGDVLLHGDHEQHRRRSGEFERDGLTAIDVKRAARPLSHITGPFTPTADETPRSSGREAAPHG
eukprot:TRINITY_DN15188_c0_g1_i1.p1 TRINITY_DN15188_c0_g1~~TRINITY_DN15188_c0_g1_i1.p1  ORF type:complete len:806 (+),score=245.96 TRINITY_DN15188_c0_g1_i1:96-2513(+)